MQPQHEQEEGLVREIDSVEPTAISLISQAELNQQIVTAKKFPRSIQTFIDEATTLVSLNEAVAGECMYALKRGGKVIEGPSARFAEIVAHSWGNCRAAARVVDINKKFVTAQGVFHDLEKNVAIMYEVQRRITDRSGKTFNDDMITVTSNAACSIALRNAVFKGIPKAFWSSIAEVAKRTIAGDLKTIENRRRAAVETLIGMGATEEAVLAMLEVPSVADIGQEHLVLLRQVLTAIKDGDTTIQDQFPTKSEREKRLENLGAKGKAPTVPTNGAQPSNPTDLQDDDIPQ